MTVWSGKHNYLGVSLICVPAAHPTRQQRLLLLKRGEEEGGGKKKKKGGGEENINLGHVKEQLGQVDSDDDDDNDDDDDVCSFSFHCFF